MLPTLEEARDARRRPVRRDRPEDHDRGLEEDPRARPQRRRSATTASSPRASSSRSRPRPIQIREALAPLYKELAKATGSKKGAVTKHINRIVDGLLDEARARRGGRGARRRRRHEEPREGARPRQGPARGDARAGAADADAEAIRELANDLCLRTDGKIAKEDLRRDRPVAAEGARDVPWTSSRGGTTPARRRSRPSAGSRRPGSCSRTSSRRWSSTTSRSSAS